MERFARISRRLKIRVKPGQSSQERERNVDGEIRGEPRELAIMLPPLGGIFLIDSCRRSSQIAGTPGRRIAEETASSWSARLSTKFILTLDNESNKLLHREKSAPRILNVNVANKPRNKQKFFSRCQRFNISEF